MKISIITVAYNAEKTIKDTIESVLSQTHPDIEYIIIDGLSKDSTMEIVKSYQNKIHTVVSEADNGLYDAMNKGLNLATGDIIGILNADDIFNNNTVLEKVAKLFVNNIDGVYADLTYVSEDLSQIKRLWKTGEYNEDNWKKGWVPPHPTFFARKNVYENFGTFDLEYSLAADYELLFRFIKKHKIKLAYLPEITVKMRIGGVSNQSTSNIITQNKEIFAIWRKHGIKLNTINFAYHKLINRLQQRKQSQKLP